VKTIPAILILAALLAACGTAGSTGSSNAREHANAGAVQVSQAANADSELDVNRVNPPVTKGARPTPASVLRPQTVTPNGVQPATPQDRCTDGFGTGTGPSSRAATPGSGKPFPLPLCLPE